MLGNRHNKPRSMYKWLRYRRADHSTSAQTVPPAVLTLKNANAASNCDGNCNCASTVERTAVVATRWWSAGHPHLQRFMTIVWVNCKQQIFSLSPSRSASQSRVRDHTVRSTDKVWHKYCVSFRLATHLSAMQTANSWAPGWATLRGCTSGFISSSNSECGYECECDFELESPWAAVKGISVRVSVTFVMVTLIVVIACANKLTGLWA